MNTVLVTGGAGFIGSNLCDRLLNDGNNVIVIDNFDSNYDPAVKEKNVKNNLNNVNYQLIRKDIRDYNALDLIFNDTKIDVIVHLAAKAGVRASIDDPIAYEDVNIKGTQNILELAKKYGVKKLVLASSSSVYGNNKKVPFSETDNVDFAISPYAATKKSNEVMGHVYHSLYDMDIVFLRFFTVYGPRQRPDLAINKFMSLILEGKEIPVFGDGSTSRDYTYVDDIIDGVVKSIKYVANNEKVFEIFNLGESEPITLSEMISTIEETVSIKAKIKKLPMQPGDVERTYADISKAKNIIGYNPQTSFKDGIKKFFEWKIGRLE